MKKIAKLLIPLSLFSGCVNASLTDPTKPPKEILIQQSTSSRQPLELSATFIYPKDKVAIINQQVLHVGNSIGEYKIIAIKKNMVELLGASKKILSLQLIQDVKRKG